VLVLSYAPARDLLRRQQLMNFSFNPIHLVNAYGAFGSITRVRYEIAVEGTTATDVTPQVEWTEYESISRTARTSCITTIRAR
jgi:hypothetical protein